MSLYAFLVAIFAALLSGLSPTGTVGSAADTACAQDTRSKQAKTVRHDRRVALTKAQRKNPDVRRYYLLM